MTIYRRNSDSEAAKADIDRFAPRIIHVKDEEDLPADDDDAMEGV